MINRSFLVSTLVTCFAAMLIASVDEIDDLTPGVLEEWHNMNASRTRSILEGSHHEKKETYWNR